MEELELRNHLENLGIEVGITAIHRLLGDHHWATLDDYLKANKTVGLRVMKRKGRAFDIVHEFSNGERVVVPTREKTVRNFGTIALGGFEEGKTFAVALLWRFHGEPCQRRSYRAGGEGYSRI